MHTEILIIGYGNAMRGDDGAGCRAVERLEKIPSLARHCDLRVCHQLLPEHAEIVSHYALVIFVDASWKDAPGEVSFYPLPASGNQIREDVFSPHRMGPSDVLAIAQNLYASSPSAYMCCIGGESFEVTDRLSTAVEDALCEFEQRIKAFVGAETAGPRQQQPAVSAPVHDQSDIVR